MQAMAAWVLEILFLEMGLPNCLPSPGSRLMISSHCLKHFTGLSECTEVYKTDLIVLNKELPYDPALPFLEITKRIGKYAHTKLVRECS